MRPLTLTLKGLYSYQEKQTIDFDKLTKASIFGIFGTVGSGKSSILEAITFALYGKTDRLNLSGDNRNYNMMNLKSNELLIDFEFMAGNPIKKFKITVSAKRNRKKFEDVKTLDRKAYEWKQNSWIPIELSYIEQTLELSYENFKRTIIIPQGKFQEFLQLGNKDRTQMMKELFNLEKYELYYPTVALEQQNNSVLDDLNGQLKILGELSADELTKLKDKAHNLQQQLSKLSSELNKQTALQKEFEQLKLLFEKLKLAQQNNEKLQQQEPAILLQEKQLAAFEHCKLNFESLLKQQNDQQTEIKKNTNVLEISKQKLKDNEQLLQKTEAEFNVAEKQYAQIDQFKKEITETEHLTDILVFTAKIQEDKNSIAKGEDFMRKTEQQVAFYKKQITTLESELASLKKDKPDVLKLSTIKTWFTKLELLENQQKEFISKQKLTKQKITNTQSNIHEILQKQPIFNNHKFESFTTILPFIDDQIKLLKTDQIRIEKEIAHVNVQHKLADYAEALHEGDPCPLCGATHHPKLYDVAHAKTELIELQTQKEKLVKKVTTLENTQKNVAQMQTKLELLSDDKKQIAIQLKKINEIIAQHKSLHQWPEYNTLTKVKAALKQASQAEQKINDAEVKLNSLRKEFDTATQNLERAKNKIETYKNSITSNTASVNTLAKQITILDIQQYKNYSIENINHLKSSKQQHVKTIETNYKRLNEVITKLRQEKAVLQEKLKNTEKIIADNHLKLNTINNELSSNLQKSNYQNLTDISEILKLDLDTESEHKKIDTYKQQKVSNNQEINKLNNEINRRTYQPEKHQEINKNIANLSTAFRLKDQELGSITNQMKQKEKSLEKQKELLVQKEKLENRAENLKTLKQLFKGSRFVNYISTVHLQQICTIANARFFKLTGQKLSLELAEDNNFVVRDFMNGGKTRNIKTLSGGQTFQAALSLAMALADSIQNKTHAKENFFFLDEGFGSLDKDSLNLVFDTLKMLRKENRIVGVISHVEEMQHEIDAHLKITMNQELGSQISSSV